MTEDQIAALDFDWQQYPEAEQAAFEVARKLTSAPQRFGQADFDRLRKHYSESQVLEILFTVSNNNATNRWTGGLGIPQDENSSGLMRAVKAKGEFRTFLTPTADKYKETKSLVAPQAGRSKESCPGRRPALEDRGEVEAALAACARREPRLTLAEETKARAVLPKDWSDAPLPQWVRLLTLFPKAGTGRVVGLRAAEEKGALKPLLKAQVAWIAARQDRARYALGNAKRRLKALGQSDDAIYALDGTGEGQAEADRLAFAFARKLTAYPEEVTDEDVAGLRKHFRDGEVAELVLHIANAAFFDRVTEACQLRLEKHEQASRRMP